MENQNNPANENQSQFPSAFSLFGPSLSIIGRNFETFLALLLAPLLLLITGVVISFIATASTSDGVNTGASIVDILFSVTSAVLYILVMPGIIVTQIRGAYDKSISPLEAFKTGLSFFWRLLGQTLLLTLIFAVSFILLIVPFFFMYKRYILAPYYLVHDNLGIMDSLRKSAADSKQFSKPVWGLVGVDVLVNLVSAIPFVGWIVPLLYSCAPAARYKEIMEAKGDAGDTLVAEAPVEAVAPSTPAN